MKINNDRLSRFKYYIQISIIDFFCTMGEEIVRCSVENFRNFKNQSIPTNLGISSQLKIWQVSACQMGPHDGILFWKNHPSALLYDVYVCIAKEPLIGSYWNFKLIDQTKVYKCFTWRWSWMEDNLKIIKWKISSTEILNLLTKFKFINASNEDDLPWKTTSEYKCGLDHI